MAQITITPVTINSLGETAGLIVPSILANKIATQFYTTKIVGDIKSEKQKIAEQESKQDSYLSLFNLPVFDSLTFDGSIYLDAHLNEVVYPTVAFGMVLINISQEKVVVRTNTIGRVGGTVKEFINTGDFNINIKGVLTSGQQNVYPEDSFSDLYKICQSLEPVSVVSNLFTRFGISSIVILNYNFPQEEGMRDIQKFEINAVSTLPIKTRTK